MEKVFVVMVQLNSFQCSVFFSVFPAAHTLVFTIVFIAASRARSKVIVATGYESITWCFVGGVSMKRLLSLRNVWSKPNVTIMANVNQLMQRKSIVRLHSEKLKIDFYANFEIRLVTIYLL